MKDRRRTFLLLALAAVGACISAYLAAFELGLLNTVWDPLFDGGSARVLSSPISRALPLPDAVIGTLAYALELALIVVVTRTGDRRAVFALGLLASAGAVTAIALAVLQPVVVGALCSLCLVSATVSVCLALGVLLEVRAVIADRKVARRQEEEIARS